LGGVSIFSSKLGSMKIFTEFWDFLYEFIMNNRH
jgi:hypothetical protein